MWFWIFSTIFWTLVMSFYSMQEMACISFNRLRLEVAVRSGSRRAACIKHMLDNPMLLFTTTLVGVNLSLVISSESMRRVFTTLDLNPNLSPIIEAPYMIICGELIPMFAARLFPEHMARLGIPFLWLSSKILAPITFCIDCILSSVRRIFFSENVRAKAPRLQRDELRELIEEKKRGFTEEDDIESMVSQIFNLRERPISHIMLPLEQFPIVKSSFFSTTVKDILLNNSPPFALVKNRQGKIIGYVQSKDLISTSPTTSVGSILRSGTFVSEQINAIETLLLLQKQESYLAFIVGSKGEIVGLVTLDGLLSELIKGRGEPQLLHIEKTVSSDVRIDSFLERYEITVPHIPAQTFGELVEKLLGHKPSLNDSVHFGPLEITVKEVGIRGAKTLLVKTTI